MSVKSLMPRDSRDWTVEDLELLPDDGLQYELMDGVLMVSPAPVMIHQRALGELYFLLRNACSAGGLKIFPSPLDWQPDLRTSLQPDVLVVRAEDLWVVDPDEPSIVVFELQDGHYVEYGRASGSEVLRIERPFPMSVTPTALVEP